MREAGFAVNRDIYKPPTPEQMAKLWAATVEARENDPEVYKAFLLAAGAGLRLGEIAHLR